MKRTRRHELEIKKLKKQGLNYNQIGNVIHKMKPAGEMPVIEEITPKLEVGTYEQTITIEKEAKEEKLNWWRRLWHWILRLILRQS